MGTPSRKSMHRRSLATTPGATFSPLRRSTAAPATPFVLMNETDDEVERSRRRHEMDIHRRLSSVSSVATPGAEINQFVNEKQVRDHLRICTKLYVENKISIKNAWELQVIDLIRKIVRTEGDNVLQVAGSSLEIGAKVFGLRVDDVHSRGLKLASTMARTEERQENDEADGDDVNKSLQTKKRAVRKKKKPLGNKNTVDHEGKTLFAPPKMLEPVLFSTNESIDVSATDNLFTNKLPVNPANQLFMLLTNEKYWVTSDDVTLQGSDRLLDIEFPNISQSRLCDPLKDFEIGNWDPETEKNLIGNDTVLQNVVLDDDGLPIPELDGSIHDIFENDGQADSESDTEYHQEFNVQLNGAVVHVVDAIPEEHRVQTDYGYNSFAKAESGGIIDRIWAGPHHWKVKYMRPSTARYSGSVVQQVVRHRKTKIQENKMNFSQIGDIVIKEVSVKRASAKYSTEKVTLPSPLIYDDFYAHFRRFHTKSGVFTIRKNSVVQQTPECETAVYNYENPNDSYYCSQHNISDGNGADIDNHSFEEGAAPAACQNFLSDHLVEEPDMVTANYLTYALQSKKMDMKKLKLAVWKKLTTNSGEQEPVVKTMKFSHLYGELPGVLNKDMKKELSCPLALAAILHLCNENNLILTQDSSDCFKDFTIQKAVE